jgi:hypothetical protein
VKILDSGAPSDQAFRSSERPLTLAMSANFAAVRSNLILIQYLPFIHNSMDGVFWSIPECLILTTTRQ